MKDITKIIENHMPKCASYNPEYCDSILCGDCILLDKSIRLELQKEYGSCFRCMGVGIRSGIVSDLSLSSQTKTCNVCAGTGRFIQSIER